MVSTSREVLKIRINEDEYNNLSIVHKRTWHQSSVRKPFENRYRFRLHKFIRYC